MTTSAAVTDLRPSYRAAGLTALGVLALYVVTLALRDGEHRYAFVVDGTRWVPDPRAARSARAENGRIYSLLTVSRATN